MRPELAESRREQILASATELFARGGFANTDLQQVANALGVGKGTVYRYFPSKRELFLAAVDRAMNQLRAAVNAGIAGEAEPLKRLSRGIETYLEFFSNHPEFVELLIQERAAFRDRLTPTYFKHREANVGEWKAMYRELIGAGVVRDIPVDRITDVISQLVYGTMFTNYFLHRENAASGQAAELLDVVFHGILTGGAPGEGTLS